MSAGTVATLRNDRDAHRGDCEQTLPGFMYFAGDYLQDLANFSDLDIA
jgi:hypothetical protein